MVDSCLQPSAGTLPTAPLAYPLCNPSTRPLIYQPMNPTYGRAHASSTLDCTPAPLGTCARGNARKIKSLQQKFIAGCNHTKTDPRNALMCSQEYEPGLALIKVMQPRPVDNSNTRCTVTVYAQSTELIHRSASQRASRCSPHPFTPHVPRSA
jgi:hypothetical protein